MASGTIWCERNIDSRLRLTPKPVTMSHETDPVRLLFAESPQIETERLILRPLEMSDDEAVYAYGRDPEVSRLVIFETHRSIEDARTFLASVQEFRVNG